MDGCQVGGGHQVTLDYPDQPQIESQLGTRGGFDRRRKGNRTLEAEMQPQGKDHLDSPEVRASKENTLSCSLQRKRCPVSTSAQTSGLQN